MNWIYSLGIKMNYPGERGTQDWSRWLKAPTDPTPVWGHLGISSEVGGSAWPVQS